MATAVQNSYVSTDPAVCGGKPCVAGTRIRVHDIFLLYELQGMSVDEIIDGYPRLTPAQVFAALSYYWDHREEIDEHMRQADARVEQLRKLQGPSILERKLMKNHGS